ncbi:hypothetical protein [Brevundimonas sp.]|uniref:hypothetical protein n=1 Tax=Brevundimonas sp. TaxID=1871086 RepID=UPI003F6E5B7D
MTMPAFALFLSLAAPQEGPLPDTLFQQPTADLARTFSIPDADAVLWHEVKPADRMGPPPPPGISFQGTARFFYAATSSETGVCRRDAAVVRVAQRDGDVQQRGPVQHITELGVAPDCEPDIRQRFASVRPEDADLAADQLSRLIEIQRRLQSGRPAGVVISCRSEQQGFRCPQDADALFAQLPLARIYWIGRQPGADALIFGATDGEPGDPMWDIRLTGDRLELLRRIPAPF